MNERDYLGKTILIGIGVFYAEGEVTHRFQVAGKIIKILSDRIEVLPFNRDTLFCLPPDLDNLSEANPGVYQLKNANLTELENPDYLTTFDIQSSDDVAIEKIMCDGFQPPNFQS